MSLYDIVPENLFSVLASGNKSLYSNALFVVPDAFKTHLKIPKDELSLMIQTRPESDIYSADFDDENVYENETGLSGKAHFLIRKLKETGWISVEYEDDFKEYVTVPNFSYKIIQTLYDISHATETENFAYVYSSYSSLKTADESKDAKDKVYYWGDIDMGGFNMFCRLKRNIFPTLEPLNMDCSCFEKYREKGLARNEDYIQRLLRLKGNENYSVFSTVIDLIAQYGVTVEQEAFLE